MLRAIDKEITILYGILQCMIDINDFVVDRRREKKRRIKCIMIDESMITNGEVYWLWVAYEPYIKKYLLMHTSKERTVLVCYDFIKELRRLKSYGNRYTVYTDGAHYYDQACRWLRIRHHYVYDQEDKNVMERAVQYINKG